MWHYSLSLGLLVVGLILTIVFTAHSISTVCRQSHERCFNRHIYQDEDGTSTQEAKERFSNSTARSIVLLLSIVGFCIAIIHVLLFALSYRRLIPPDVIGAFIWVRLPWLAMRKLNLH
jgi:hypothetical protein